MPRLRNKQEELIGGTCRLTRAEHTYNKNQDLTDFVIRGKQIGKYVSLAEYKYIMMNEGWDVFDIRKTKGE